MKREAAFVDEAVSRRKDSGILRLVKIQATRIVSGPHTERFDRYGIELVEPQRRPAFAAIGIVNEG